MIDLSKKLSEIDFSNENAKTEALNYLKELRFEIGLQKIKEIQERGTGHGGWSILDDNSFKAINKEIDSLERKYTDEPTFSERISGFFKKKEKEGNNGI